MIEIYKEIENYNGIYKVSKCGNVKSLKFNKEKILKSRKDRDGYLLVGLCKESQVKTFKIHRLVAAAFIPNPNNLPQVNHKDKDVSNNNDWNLEWNTSRENNVHKYIGKNTSSKYCGVSWYKPSKKWVAIVMLKGKQKYLGYFNLELEAYQARINFEKENNIENKYL